MKPIEPMKLIELKAVNQMQQYTGFYRELNDWRLTPNSY
jgi:hypothetical protein